MMRYFEFRGRRALRLRTLAIGSAVTVLSLAAGCDSYEPTEDDGEGGEAGTSMSQLGGNNSTGGTPGQGGTAGKGGGSAGGGSAGKAGAAGASGAAAAGGSSGHAG